MKIEGGRGDASGRGCVLLPPITLNIWWLKAILIYECDKGKRFMIRCSWWCDTTSVLETWRVPFLWGTTNMLWSFVDLWPITRYSGIKPERSQWWMIDYVGFLDKSSLSHFYSHQINNCSSYTVKTLIILLRQLLIQFKQYKVN